jgi:hypothetical protein
MRASSLALSLAAVLSLGASGCIKKIMVDGQIQAFRQAAPAVDTVGDLEAGRGAATAGLAQFEGMHALSPDNTDALFLLTKTWGGYGFGFIEDDLEAAQDAGDDDLAEYHQKRARMAYDRAVFYGLQLLGQSAEGFEDAKKSEQTLKKWLADNFNSAGDAPNLFWTGYAWLARVDLMKGDDEEGPNFIAELYVGIAMLERAVALDPAAEHYNGLIALAAYHARNAMAEPEESKKLFDEALAKTQGKNLMVQLNYATRYACVKGDAALYQDMLNKVIQAKDPDPEERLENAIAKRRAKRWLGKHRAKDHCGIDVGGSSKSAK